MGCRYPREECKDQDGVGDMQQDIRDVIARRLEAENCRIEHQRQPRERDPVAVAKGGETPGDVLE